MSAVLKTDIAIIGAGAGGLSVAAGAVQMGARVILIESHQMGGDCLNYGCVPSKALLAAAKTAHSIRHADDFGIQSQRPEIDIPTVMASVQKVINKLAVHDSVERFEKLGVKVLSASAAFVDGHTILAGDTSIQARRFVIATGSTPAVPPIPGLTEVKFYTNESIFGLTEHPQHLIIIGGGPIGCELAQAFLLLGVKVTVIEGSTILPRDEQDLVATLRATLLSEGLNLYEQAKVMEVQSYDEMIAVSLEHAGEKITLQGSHLLIATGRRPNINQLNLAAAHIKYSAQGITVNSRLRTSNSHVYAMGDVIGSYQFTHIAGYHAGIILRNILFRLPAKVNYTAVPWVTYTQPELAHVGLSSVEALKLDPHIKVFTCEFANNDRAQTERESVGKIKLITNKKGLILGVTILGPQAGELLAPWISAIQNKKTVRTLTEIIIPYPTLSEINKRVASEYYMPLLFSECIKKIVKFLNFFG